MSLSLPSLDALGLQFGTDKASIHHNYLNFYEGFFGKLRHETLRILEIGVYNGASLKTWEAYFPLAKIVGVDIAPRSRRFAGGRVAIEIADQSDIEALTRVATTHGPFDVIIEDGSHMWEHQITTLRTLFPFVRPGGIYIVEDLQTNYGAMERDYRGIASGSCVEFLKKWLDLRVGDDLIDIGRVEDPFLRTYGRAVEFMTFYRRACLIQKQMPPRHENGGAPLAPRPEIGALAPVAINAHVSHRGDVFCPHGYINLGSDRETLQGVSLESKALEYRVRFADGSWSPWCQDGQFAGSRGQSRLLTGLTLRLREDAAPGTKLHAMARYSGSAALAALTSGQDSLAPPGSVLCALQIDLTSDAPPKPAKT